MSDSSYSVAAKGLRDSVSAIFGPAAHEIGDYLADKVRFHRYRSLTKILNKVQDKYGEQPRIPPYKFFVPFCEQASLEEDSDEVIIDIWAKLLNDAVKEFSSRHMIFLRLVKEITSQEAQLLYDICYRSRGVPDSVGVWGVSDAPGSISEAAIYNFLVEWVEHLPSGSAKPFRNHLIEKFEIPGVLIRHITFAKGERGVWPYGQADDDGTSDLASPLEKRYPRISFDILRGLNILNEVVTDEIWYNTYMVTLSYFEISPLGVEFFSLCNGGSRVLPQQGNYWSPETGWQWR